MDDIAWRHSGDVDLAYRLEIRRRVRWETVLGKLGIPFRPNAHGKIMILCMLHGEKTPSLRLWPNGSFLCLGCHWGWRDGDIATFMFDLFQRRHHDGFGAVSKAELDEFFDACVPVLEGQLKLPSL